MENSHTLRETLGSPWQEGMCRKWIEKATGARMKGRVD